MTPLGLVDLESLAPRDLAVCDLVCADRTGEIYQGVHDADHRWYYFPKMTRDEAILIKCYDSLKDGRARFSLHSAFDDPTTPANPRPRQSIEARAFAFLIRAHWRCRAPAGVGTSRIFAVSGENPCRESPHGSIAHPNLRQSLPSARPALGIAEERRVAAFQAEHLAGRRLRHRALQVDADGMVVDAFDVPARHRAEAFLGEVSGVVEIASGCGRSRSIALWRSSGETSA